MSHKRTAVGAFCHATWINLNLRCANGKYRHLAKAPTLRRSAKYESVYLNLTFAEFKAWCWQQQVKIETLARPSIDRLDSTKNYTLDNIQIIELAENIRKAKTVFADGYGVCFKCKQKKPETEFAKDKRRINGHSTLCRLCDRGRSKKAPNPCATSS